MDARTDIFPAPTSQECPEKVDAPPSGKKAPGPPPDTYTCRLCVSRNLGSSSERILLQVRAFQLAFRTCLDTGYKTAPCRSRKVLQANGGRQWPPKTLRVSASARASLSSANAPYHSHSRLSDCSRRLLVLPLEPASHQASHRIHWLRNVPHIAKRSAHRHVRCGELPGPRGRSLPHYSCAFI